MEMMFIVFTGSSVQLSQASGEGRIQRVRPEAADERRNPCMADVVGVNETTNLNRVRGMLG